MGYAKEFNIDAMKTDTNPFRRASNRRVLARHCKGCGKMLGIVGGTAFRTTTYNWYCSVCKKGIFREEKITKQQDSPATSPVVPTPSEALKIKPLAS